MKIQSQERLCRRGIMRAKLERHMRKRYKEYLHSQSLFSFWSAALSFLISFARKETMTKTIIESSIIIHIQKSHHTFSSLSLMFFSFSFWLVFSILYMYLPTYYLTTPQPTPTLSLIIMPWIHQSSNPNYEFTDSKRYIYRFV